MTGFSPPPPPPPSFSPPTNPFATTEKPPAPPVTVGAGLLVLGGVLMIVGSFLNWFDFDGATFNGFTSGLEDFTNVKGGIFDVLGALAVGFGVTQLAAKKILALGIIGAVTSAIGLIIGLKALSDVNDFVDLGRFLGFDVSTGPGLYVATAGAIVATIGSLATIAKQRV